MHRRARTAFRIISLALLFFSAPSGADALSVGTIERPPFAFYGENGELSGFSIELWQEIASRASLDFEWDVHTQFASMIDGVTSGKQELAIANISITSARERSADFSHPIFSSGMAIAVKKGANYSIIRMIWESGILWFLLGALLLVFLVANIIWFFERGIEDGRHDYFRDDYVGGVWDAFWWAFVILTMGGFEKEVPHKIINRLLAMFWIIVSLFFISTLTAKITTAFTVAELKTGINGYQDLAGKQVGVTDGSSHQKFLNSHGIQTQQYASMEQLYIDLENQKLDAIVADFPILSYHASHGGAGWMNLAGDSFNAEDFGMLLQENSPLLETVNEALLELREEGTYFEVYQKYFGQGS